MLEFSHMEDFSFPKYLASKRAVDDRALNFNVWNRLAEHLVEMENGSQVRVLELGAGTGAMFQRMAEWGALSTAHYTMVDQQEENIQAGIGAIEEWAARQGHTARREGPQLYLSSAANQFTLEFAQADAGDFAERSGRGVWDLVVAHAFLDLVDVPKLLARVIPAVRSGGLFYFTINFDGLTLFEPEIAGDAEILAAYHRSMEERGSGDSLTGRRLFGWLREAGLRLVEAGASDWVVFPRRTGYSHDEKHFLQDILYFFKSSLHDRLDLPAGLLDSWLTTRRMQIDRGELVFIAHQIDFLAQRD